MENPAIEVSDLSTKALRDFVSIMILGEASHDLRDMSRRALLDGLFIISVEDDLLKDLVRAMPKKPCKCGACHTRNDPSFPAFDDVCREGKCP